MVQVLKKVIAHYLRRVQVYGFLVHIILVPTNAQHKVILPHFQTSIANQRLRVRRYGTYVREVEGFY